MTSKLRQLLAAVNGWTGKHGFEFGIGVTLLLPLVVVMILYIRANGGIEQQAAIAAVQPSAALEVPHLWPDKNMVLRCTLVPAPSSQSSNNEQN